MQIMTEGVQERGKEDGCSLLNCLNKNKQVSKKAFPNNRIDAIIVCVSNISDIM
jgi:hypothetical protein